jgi:hypothetical protein
VKKLCYPATDITMYKISDHRELAFEVGFLRVTYHGYIWLVQEFVIAGYGNSIRGI